MPLVPERCMAPPGWVTAGSRFSSWCSEPGGEGVTQSRIRAVPHPGDISVGPDQHGGGSGDRAEHRKLPHAGVRRRRSSGPGQPTA